MQKKLNKQKTIDLASLGEKPAGTGLGMPAHAGVQRQLRTLPFSRRTFEKIASKFFLHKSIARTISRADIPMFSFDRVQIGEPNKMEYDTFGRNVLSRS